MQIHIFSISLLFSALLLLGSYIHGQPIELTNKPTPTIVKAIKLKSKLRSTFLQKSFEGLPFNNHLVLRGTKDMLLVLDEEGNCLTNYGQRPGEKATNITQWMGATGYCFCGYDYGSDPDCKWDYKDGLELGPKYCLSDGCKECCVSWFIPKRMIHSFQASNGQWITN